MPIIIKWIYKDGSEDIEYINAYIWRKNEKTVIKTFAKDKEVASIKIDPYRETGDIDESNNTWPQELIPSRYEVFKNKVQTRGQNNESNPMKKRLEMGNGK